MSEEKGLKFIGKDENGNSRPVNISNKGELLTKKKGSLVIIENKKDILLESGETKEVFRGAVDCRALRFSIRFKNTPQNWSLRLIARDVTDRVLGTENIDSDSFYKTNGTPAVYILNECYHEFLNWSSSGISVMVRNLNGQELEIDTLEILGVV